MMAKTSQSLFVIFGVLLLVAVTEAGEYGCGQYGGKRGGCSSGCGREFGGRECGQRESFNFCNFQRPKPPHIEPPQFCLPERPEIPCIEPPHIKPPHINPPPRPEIPCIEPPNIQPPHIRPPHINPPPRPEIPCIEPPHIEPPCIEPPHIKPPKIPQFCGCDDDRFEGNHGYNKYSSNCGCGKRNEGNGCSFCGGQGCSQCSRKPHYRNNWQ